MKLRLASVCAATLIFALTLLAVTPVSTPAAPSCESLMSLSLSDATVLSATLVPMGPFTLDEHQAFANAAEIFSRYSTVNLPEYCRVQLLVKPSINITVLLPTTTWNGNFNGVGSQGLAGFINYLDMIPLLRMGYATASTDSGHTSNKMIDWAYKHPDLVIDFGYRGIHEMTVQAKAVIQAFYGTAPHYSYFEGCSNAGRQAMMEVVRYPRDYDGVLAGDPLNNFTSAMMGGELWDQLALLKQPESYITADKLPAVADAALLACDAKDGVKDGIISNPERCNFDPSVLLCKGADSASCLTGPQLEAVKKLYSGPPPLNGKPIYPGYVPGSERGWTFSLGSAPGKSGQFANSTGFLKYIVYDNADWDYHTWDYKEFPAAQKKATGLLDATDPNIEPFFSHGGKLIMYHGWSDPIIPPSNTVNYYESMLSKSKHGKEDARLFMVPGMNHCGGGAGPYQFDARIALANWVEKKDAPERIIASNPPNNPVKRTRPLCAYPKVAHYTGQGSTDDEANFVCEMPKADE